MLGGLRVLFFSAALVLASASLGANAYFWITSQAGRTELIALTVVLSVTAGLIKIGVPAYIARTNSSFGREPTLLLVFALVFTFDIASGIGFTGMLRGKATAALEAYNAAVKENSRLTAIANGKVASVKAGRPVVSVKPEYDQAQREAGSCKDAKSAGGEKCRKASELLAELSAAQFREQHLAEIEKLQAEAANLKRPEDTSIAAVLAKPVRDLFGVEPNLGVVYLIWSGILFAMFDVVPPVLMAAAFRTVHVPPAPLPRSTPALTSNARRPAAPVPSAPGLSVLELLRQEPKDANGWITGLSQQAIADRLRVAKASVNRQMQADEAAGRLERDPSKRPAALRVI